jgi:hypothetical protein
MTIQDFPLAWRWTQPSHSVLPAEALAGIRPLSAREAADVCVVTPAGTASVVSTSASDSREVSQWLRRVQPDSHAAVYVSWSTDLAVETSWSIFAEYWDDFCYPSSDDVTVVPVSGGWQLVYHHYEQFDFTSRS